MALTYAAVMFLEDRRVAVVKLPRVHDGVVHECGVVTTCARNEFAATEDTVILAVADSEEEAKVQAQLYYNEVSKAHRNTDGTAHIATQFWDAEEQRAAEEPSQLWDEEDHGKKEDSGGSGAEEETDCDEASQLWE